MGMPSRTRSGYVVYEVLSALQKDIRRGNFEEAFFWVNELLDVGLQYLVFKRLRVIVHEDISTADIVSSIFVIKCLEQFEDWYMKYLKDKSKEKPSRSWELPLTNALAVMCHARKNRLADYAKTVIYGRRRLGWKPEMPEYALDRHTRRGQQMGKGVDDFIENSCQLKEGKIRSAHEFVEEARKYWKLAEEEGLNIKELPEEDDEWVERYKNLNKPKKKKTIKVRKKKK